MSRRDDGVWVARALEGSQDAYHELLRRYQRPVFALVVRMVGDAALAEELAQEVFLKAFRNLVSYDRRRKLSNWLFKIAHNTCLDHLRRKQVATVPLEGGGEDDPGPTLHLADPGSRTPEEEAGRGDLARHLEAAVRELRPEHRDVFLLRFQEGLTYEEIAEVTDLPLGTVKTFLHRARKKLARILSEQGWGPARGG